MVRAAAVIALSVFTAASAPVWLDAKAPVNWNVAGAMLPSAPGPKDAELASGGRCASESRPPSTREDRAVAGKGWSLIGPYERYGRTSLVLAASSADGMCRPNGYQAFVFVGDVFAGTLSPKLMDSRSDASLSMQSIGLYDQDRFSATFARYADSDALCCPHASTSVDYEIKTTGDRHVVAPVSAQTNKN